MKTTGYKQKGVAVQYRDWNDPENPIGYEPDNLSDEDDLLSELYGLLDELEQNIKKEGLTLDADEFWQRAWDDIVEGNPEFREEPRFSDAVAKWREANV